MRRHTLTILASLLFAGCLSPSHEDDPTPHFDAGPLEAIVDSEAPLLEPGVPPDDLRIVSYNLERLFFPPPSPWSTRHYRERVQRFGALFAEMDADIMGVTEINDVQVLYDLVEATREHGGPDYIGVAIAPGHDTSGGLDVGLLSRFPITRYSSEPIVWPYDCVNSFGPIHLDETIPFPRPILQAHVDVDVDGLTDLVFFVNHWKSKAAPSAHRCVYTDDDRRRAGLQLRDLFEGWAAKNPDMPLIALGDFNCEEGEAPLSEALGAGLHPREITGPSDILNAWGLRLDVKEGRGHRGNSSYSYRGSWRRIDHIILSGHFRPGGESEYLPVNIEAYSSGLLRAGTPYRAPGGYSDHLPVILDLTR